jgi:hypothetical protein
MLDILSNLLYTNNANEILLEFCARISLAQQLVSISYQPFSAIKYLFVHEFLFVPIGSCTNIYQVLISPCPTLGEDTLREGFGNSFVAYL